MGYWKVLPNRGFLLVLILLISSLIFPSLFFATNQIVGYGPFRLGMNEAALAKAAPDRVAVRRYAESWEGRELIYVVLTSAENMARIDDIKSGMQQLVDPRKTSTAKAREITASQPAVKATSLAGIDSLSRLRSASFGMPL